MTSLLGAVERPARPRSTAAAAGTAAPSGLAMVSLVFVVFGLSGGILWTVGYNYDGLTGGVLTKIHPATYLTIAMFAWAALKAGNPVGEAFRSMRQRPASLLLALAGLTFLLEIVARGAPGMAGAIDTYLGPALLVMLLADLDEKGMRRVEIALHIVMTVNALMGVAEFVLKTRFYPYRFDGAIFPTDTRSAALQGHPLVNAAITTWYCLALLNGCRVLPNALRLPLIGLQFAALVTFGGRTGMVLSILLGGIHLIGVTNRALRSGRIPLVGAALSLILTALVPVAVAGLAAQGFFDDLLTRFVSDGGSANARIEMFAMFDMLSWRDLMAGPNTGLVESMWRVNGLEWGIENPIIKTLLYHGIPITLFLTVAVVLFVWEMMRFCAPGTWMILVAFIVLMNTSESIGGKTTLLSKFALITICLYRPAVRPLTPAAATAPTPG